MPPTLFPSCILLEISLYLYKHIGMYGASLVAQAVKNRPAMQEIWVYPWVGKIPWRRKWQPTPTFLSGKSHGQRSLTTVHEVMKTRT